jgi:hypothetical protein
VDVQLGHNRPERGRASVVCAWARQPGPGRILKARHLTPCLDAGAVRRLADVATGGSSSEIRERLARETHRGLE